MTTMSPHCSTLAEQFHVTRRQITAVSRGFFLPVVAEYSDNTVFSLETSAYTMAILSVFKVYVGRLLW